MTFSIINNAQPDLTQMCRSSVRGFDYEEGLSQPISDEAEITYGDRITGLNDLAGLLQAKETLTRLRGFIDEQPEFILRQTNAAIGPHIGSEMARVQGCLQAVTTSEEPSEECQQLPTTIDIYGNAIDTACGDIQCTELVITSGNRRDIRNSRIDARSAEDRLADLRQADSALQRVRISDQTYFRLLALERTPQITGPPSNRTPLRNRTLLAVEALIAELAQQLGIEQDDLTVERINAMIAQDCTTANTRPVIETPVEVVPVDPYDSSLDNCEDGQDNDGDGLIDRDDTDSCHRGMSGEIPVEEPSRVQVSALGRVGGGFGGEIYADRDAALNDVIPPTGLEMTATVAGELVIADHSRAGISYDMSGRSDNSIEVPRGSVERFLAYYSYAFDFGLNLRAEALFYWNGIVTPLQDNLMMFTEQQLVGGGFGGGYDSWIQATGGILYSLNREEGQDQGSPIGGYFNARSTISILDWLNLEAQVTYLNSGDTNRVQAEVGGVFSFDIREGRGGAVEVGAFFDLHYLSQSAQRTLNAAGRLILGYRYGEGIF